MKIKDEQELSAALAGANGPLRIEGGGTRTLAHEGNVLSVAGLSGITLYEPGALTMVAQAGTPVHEIEAALAAEGQCLAFDPYFLNAGTSTIGGVMATNASGPRRIQSGAARDFLLGVTFVDGTGQIIKNGGRVMKNVTGYDLVKLLAGSRGMLGAISEVAFKVLPQPETEATLKVHGLTGEQSIAAMAQALGSPFEVTGAAHDAGVTVFRVEGFEASVGYRSQQLTELLKDFGDIEHVEDKSASQSIWASIRDATPFADQAYLARVSVKPSDAPALLGEIEAFAGAQTLLDWGGGLLWVGSAGPAEDLHEALQTFCSQHGGHTTLMRAPVDMCARVSVLQPEAPGVAALSAAIRSKFDPKGLFLRDAA